MKQQKEPEAIRELHRIREAMLEEEKRAGSASFRAVLNRLGEEFARKHRLRRVKAIAVGRGKPRVKRLVISSAPD
ncbi:MAG: hypothetical protein ABSA30_11010 [Candidatus Aminicenantales bacterium]|jgi:hypothetical protein